MSPEELREYLTKGPSKEELRVREVLKTDIKLTDQQIEYLHDLLVCVDNGYKTPAKNYALMVLDSGVTDDCLIGEMHKVLSLLE